MKGEYSKLANSNWQLAGGSWLHEVRGYFQPGMMALIVLGHILEARAKS